MSEIRERLLSEQVDCGSNQRRLGDGSVIYGQ